VQAVDEQKKKSKRKWLRGWDLVTLETQSSLRVHVRDQFWVVLYRVCIFCGCTLIGPLQIAAAAWGFGNIASSHISLDTSDSKAADVILYSVAGEDTFSVCSKYLNALIRKGKYLDAWSIIDGCNTHWVVWSAQKRLSYLFVSKNNSCRTLVGIDCLLCFFHSDAYALTYSRSRQFVYIKRYLVWYLQTSRRHLEFEFA
jgi:hypothetical protein